MALAVDTPSAEDKGENFVAIPLTSLPDMRGLAVLSHCLTLPPTQDSFGYATGTGGEQSACYEALEDASMLINSPNSLSVDFYVN